MQILLQKISEIKNILLSKDYVYRMIHPIPCIDVAYSHLSSRLEFAYEDYEGCSCLFQAGLWLARPLCDFHILLERLQWNVVTGDGKVET